MLYILGVFVVDSERRPSECRRRCHDGSISSPSRLKKKECAKRVKRKKKESRDLTDYLLSLPGGGSGGGGWEGKRMSVAIEDLALLGWVLRRRQARCNLRLRPPSHRRIARMPLSKPHCSPLPWPSAPHNESSHLEPVNLYPTLKLIDNRRIRPSLGKEIY